LTLDPTPYFVIAGPDRLDRQSIRTLRSGAIRAAHDLTLSLEDLLDSISRFHRCIAKRRRRRDEEVYSPK
jgi:hypothetical protein